MHRALTVKVAGDVYYEIADSRITIYTLPLSGVILAILIAVNYPYKCIIPPSRSGHGAWRAGTGTGNCGAGRVQYEYAAWGLYQ